MPHSKKLMEKSQTEFTITVPAADCALHLAKAATRISDRASIKGFRKGHAPYEIVKKEVGEMNILQEALEDIIKESFYLAITAEKLETVGMPKVEIEKLAPGNDIVYKATVALMPQIKLPDISKIKVEKKVKPTEPKIVDDTIDAIRGMHAAEILKNASAGPMDKVILDLNMSVDNVPIEGGQAKKYQVYLSEQHYIPGFNEQIIGLKKDEEKTFTLELPKTHYQKSIAGKKVDFQIKVHDVYERQLPELSDDLAKKLGQDSVAKLRELVENNLREEAEQKADRQFDIELLDEVIKNTEFEVIPDVIIDAERQKMMYELKRDLDRHGISIEQYLADLKKKEEDVYNDFKDQAEKRAKAALVSRQIAKEHSIAATEEEINADIAMMKDAYKDNKEYMENLERPEVRDSVASMIQNRKVMLWLKAKVLGTEMVKSGKIEKARCCEHESEDGHNHEETGN